MSGLISNDHAYYKAGGKTLERIEANRAAQRESEATLRRIAQEEVGLDLEPMHYTGRSRYRFAGYKFDTRPDTARWKVVNKDYRVYYPKAVKEMRAFRKRLEAHPAAPHVTDGMVLPGELDVFDGNSFWDPSVHLSKDKKVWLIIFPLANLPEFSGLYTPPAGSELLTLAQYVALYEGADQ